MLEASGSYHTWYGSTLAWDAGNGEMLRAMNSASSSDEDHWQRRELLVPYRIGTVWVFSKPTVVGGSTNGYDMWFSYRGAVGMGVPGTNGFGC